MGTYYLEKRAQTLEADGELQAINSIDRLQVVMHMWEFEASFAASRHEAVSSYLEAYRYLLPSELRIQEQHGNPVSWSLTCPAAMASSSFVIHGRVKHGTPQARCGLGTRGPVGGRFPV